MNPKRHPTTRPDRQRLFLNCSLRNADLRVAHGQCRVEPSRGRGLTIPNRHNGVSFRIPAVPSVSSCTQSPSSSCPLVSSCVLSVPELCDTAVTSTELSA